MIYDRPITVYDLDTASSALKRRLVNPAEYLCGEKEVYAARFTEFLRAGERVDMLCELWRADIRTGQYAVTADGRVYRVVQATHGTNRDNLPITTLNLHREEAQYDIFGNSGDA